MYYFKQQVGGITPNKRNILFSEKQ